MKYRFFWHYATCWWAIDVEFSPWWSLKQAMKLLKPEKIERLA